jgi:tRNA(fMet)-specific endonuclease VapC
LGALIDTSILVDAERGRLDLAAHAPQEDADFFLSVVTVSELMHGLHRARHPSVVNRRAAFVDRMLEQFPIISIDLAVAKVHSRIWADLSLNGEMIGMNDAWIGATCIAHGLTVITSNVREFRRVPGLQIEVWKS